MLKRNQKWQGAVLGMAALVGPLAAAAGDGVYAGLEGGVNFVPSQKFKVHHFESPGLGVSEGTLLSKSDIKTGWIAGAAAGYAFSNGLRPELAVDFRRNEFGHLVRYPVGTYTGGETDNVDGHEGVTTALANLWFDFFKSGAWHPYLGAGIGAAHISIAGGRFDTTRIRDRSRNVFAYQGGAGLAYDISSNFTVSLDYRHLESLRGDYDLIADNPNTTIRIRYRADTAMLSLRYSFAQPAPAPVAPEPAPTPAVVVPVAPTPPPPCVAPAAGLPFSLEGCKVGETLVLRGVNFEFDKARLTPDAKTLLDMVVAALSARTDIQVELDGHTDALGSDEYNQKLSQERAESVRQYLIEHGIAADRLTAVGFGETRPVAENRTIEGREYNRRVELKVTAGNGGVTSETATPAGEVPTGSAAAPVEATAAPAAEPAAEPLPVPAAESTAETPAAPAN